MYFPAASWKFNPADRNIDVVTYQTADNLALTSWYFPPKDNKPVFIMFHGNAGNVSWYYSVPEYFASRGYGFLLAEYRGYGHNSGSPSEEGFYNDGRAAMEWLIKEKKIPEDRIIVYGHSIGTGTACEMAVEYKGIKALVLEAPFTSMVAEAGDVYPWLGPFKYLTFDKFDNLSKVSDFSKPVIILQGSRDQVIPVKHGKALFDAVGSPVKKYVLLDGGGHNNLADFGLFPDIENFVRGLP